MNFGKTSWCLGLSALLLCGIVANHAALAAGRAWGLELAPREGLYPVIQADVERPALSIHHVWVVDNNIPDAGDNRLHLRLGGRYGVFRLQSHNAPGTALQVDLEAGFLGLFDMDNAQDNIGWDGFYGFSLSWSGGGGTAARIGLRHDSSHVGDEYAERTGRRRINYTREEVLVGVAVDLTAALFVYGEGAHAHDVRNAQVQEPWRARAGLQLEPGLPAGEGWRPYANIDFSAYQENDWRAAVTVQAGGRVALGRGRRICHVGLQARRGRSPLGEFSQVRESYIGVLLEVRP